LGVVCRAKGVVMDVVVVDVESILEFDEIGFETSLAIIAFKSFARDLVVTGIKVIEDNS
jgi:hypothetical protein